MLIFLLIEIYLNYIEKYQIYYCNLENNKYKKNMYKKKNKLL